MTKRPTVYDVAQAAGVSIATVSFTFRQPERVRESTRKTVVEAARRLNYVPSASARGLAHGRTGALGLYSFDMLLESDGTVGGGPSGDDPGPYFAGDVAARAFADDADDASFRTFPLYVDEVQRGFELECAHDEGLPGGVDHRPQECEHVARRARVKRTRGLVGEEHRGPRHHGSGDGDALLLPAGQLARPVPEAITEPERDEGPPDVGHGHLVAGEAQRQRYVLLRGQRAEQVEALEHEADVLAPHQGELTLGGARQVAVAVQHATARRALETGGRMQQGRLAGTRRPHDGGPAAAVEAQVDPVQRTDTRLPAPVLPHEIV